MFQSAPPVKAATGGRWLWCIFRAVSIRAAGEGGDPGVERRRRESEVSIRAAGEGGDAEDGENAFTDPVSIRAAGEGGDPWLVVGS